MESSRGRGRALTRPAWMGGESHPPPSLPSSAKTENTPVAESSPPSDWAQAKTPDGKTYWYNTKTKETSWTLPSITKTAVDETDISGGSNWKEYKTKDGRTYYHNMVSNETRWEKPEGLSQSRTGDITGSKREASSDITSHAEKWTTEEPRKVKRAKTETRASGEGELWAEAKTKDGKVYYYNKETMETSWTRPDALNKGDEEGQPLPNSDKREANRNIMGIGFDRRKRGGRKRARAVTRPRNADGSAMSDKCAERYFIEEERKRSLRRTGKQGVSGFLENTVVKPCREWTREQLEEGRKIFEDILKQNDINPDSSWLDTMARCVHDPQYMSCLPDHGHRKSVFQNYQVRRRKQIRISLIKKVRAAREGFATLLEDMFDDESENVRSLSDCPSKKKIQFEGDERYKALESAEERISLIRLYFAHRDRLVRDRRRARRDMNVKLMREFLDKMTHPDLKAGKEEELANGKDEEHQEEVKEDAVKQNGVLFTERTTYRQMCAAIDKQPFFNELSNRERGTVYDDWIRDVTRIADRRILAEKESRRKMMRANRALLRTHIEELIWAGEVHPRSTYREAETKILEKLPSHFKMADLDVKPTFVFEEAVDHFDEKIHGFRKSFEKLLSNAGVEVKEDSEKTIIADNEDLVKKLEDENISQIAVEALFWDAREDAKERRRLAERRQRRIRIDLEDLFMRKRVGGDAVFEEVKGKLGKRSAWMDYEELVGEEGLKTLFNEYVQHEKEREERRKARRAEEEAREAKLRKEAEERLVKARRAQSLASIGGSSMTGNDEESGWAVAISARPKTEKEKAEEMLRRKKEILAGISGLKADKMKK